MQRWCGLGLGSRRRCLNGWLQVNATGLYRHTHKSPSHCFLLQGSIAFREYPKTVHPATRAFPCSYATPVQRFLRRAFTLNVVPRTLSPYLLPVSLAARSRTRLHLRDIDVCVHLSYSSTLELTSYFSFATVFANVQRSSSTISWSVSPTPGFWRVPTPTRNHLLWI